MLYICAQIFLDYQKCCWQLLSVFPSLLAQTCGYGPLASSFVLINDINCSLFSNLCVLIHSFCHSFFINTAACNSAELADVSPIERCATSRSRLFVIAAVLAFKSPISWSIELLRYLTYSSKCHIKSAVLQIISGLVRNNICF